MSPDVPADARPRLRPGVRLRADPARGCTVVLAPERVLRPSATALAVLERCDGIRTADVIAGELAALYDAPADRIGADVRALLADLLAKRVLSL